MLRSISLAGAVCLAIDESCLDVPGNLPSFIEEVYKNTRVNAGIVCFSLRKVEEGNGTDPSFASRFVLQR